jgi:hypothetical protein
MDTTQELFLVERILSSNPQIIREIYNDGKYKNRTLDGEDAGEGSFDGEYMENLRNRIKFIDKELDSITEALQKTKNFSKDFIDI